MLFKIYYYSEEQIDYTYFSYLSEDDLRELMPKMIDRLKFRKGLQEFENLNDPLLSKSKAVQKTLKQDMVNLKLSFL